MTLRSVFNPLLEEGFQFITVEENYPAVNTYADLPSPASVSGEIYIVKTGTGTAWYAIGTTRRDAGLYYSDGVTWTRIGDTPYYFSATNFRVQDGTDSTKQVAFDVSGVTTATTITLTIPNASGTIALTSNLSAYLPLVGGTMTGNINFTYGGVPSLGVGPKLSVSVNPGVDKTGIDFIVETGPGTSQGIPSYFIVKTPYATGGTGSVTQSLVNRFFVGSRDSTDSVNGTIWLGNITPTNANYTLSSLAAALSLNAPTSSSLIDFKGGDVLFGRSNQGNWSFGVTGSVGYKLTNAGGTTGALAMFDGNSSVGASGEKSLAWNTTNGLLFLSGNGSTTRIARWLVNLTDVVNTAGSEASNLVFTAKNTSTDKFIINGLVETSSTITATNFLLSGGGSLASVNGSGSIVGLKEGINIPIEGPANATYYIIAKAVTARTINSLKGLILSSGSCTIAVNINGTPVVWTGSVTTISVTTSTQDVSAISANSIAVGDIVTLVFSSGAAPANFRTTMETTR